MWRVVAIAGETLVDGVKYVNRLANLVRVWVGTKYWRSVIPIGLSPSLL